MGRPWELAKAYNDPVQAEARMARIVELEDKVYARATAVAEAFLSFHEVKPGQTEPPPAWVEEFGEEGARQRLEVAKAGWLPASIAPAAAKYAIQAMAGISRGRRFNQQKAAGALNVAVITLPAPTSAASPAAVQAYPSKELE
jgi:hypothetical protein